MQAVGWAGECWIARAGWFRRSVAARAVVAMVFVVTLAGAAWAEAPPEPDGFRTEPYNAPVPETLAGARVIDAAQAMALRDEGAVFFDLHPRITRPEGLPAGTIWRDRVHLTIPDALWLDYGGYPALSEAEQTAFAQAMARAGGPDMDRPMVFFCLPDCWLSWNAARRAVGLGYTGVHWFPGGTVEWAAAGGALEAAAP
ncbi:MAG: PQQ-dependent catabolism-associated CXXCW motif protein [Paracoccus sp. (in: a-proteobacteria)]|nr:PQQ-dependent catabolism-associated CXXCW motif protein [Paracoccus sp. (in: a-proteobacteria)]